MNFSKFFKGVALSAVVVGIFVIQSPADTPSMTTFQIGGTASPLMVLIGQGDPAINNPNGFPVVYVSPAHYVYWGFLLDGSELSKSWLKTLQDAAASNKAIVVYVDQNYNNGYGADYVPGVGSTRCGRLYSIRFENN